MPLDRSAIKRAIQPPAESVQPEFAQYDEANAPGERERVSERLVRLVSDVEFFHDERRTAYASARVGRRLETLRVATDSFKEFLCECAHHADLGAPSDFAVSEAVRVLQGKAKYDGLKKQVAVRLAEHKGAVYLDLADEDGRIVCINAQGWKIVTKCPVRFLRPPGTRALPKPVRKGSIDKLRRMLNMKRDEQFALVAGFLLSAFRPSGPYPILLLMGEQDSAKSTTSLLLRSLIDPNKAPKRALPPSDRDLLISAQHAHVLCFDNVGPLSHRLSDALCRVATGGAIATRKLYTDSDEVLLEACRPIIINGIGQIATRPDLLDRTWIIELSPIEPSKRMTEGEILREFGVLAPGILGALLDAVSVALAKHEQVTVPGEIRMADAAKWAVAGSSAWGWAPKRLLTAMEHQRKERDAAAIESSPVGAAIVKLVQANPRWSGTATQLAHDLNRFVVDGAGIPQDPAALGTEISRIAPALRGRGISIERSRRPSPHRERIITIINGSPLRSPSQSALRQRQSERRRQLARGIGGSRDSGTGGTAAYSSSQTAVRERVERGNAQGEST